MKNYLRFFHFRVSNIFLDVRLKKEEEKSNDFEHKRFYHQKGNVVCNYELARIFLYSSEF